MSRMVTICNICLLVLSAITISGCAGGSGGVYYGHRYGHSPFYYRGGYVRDRVHVVTEEELKALEQVEAETMPEPPPSEPDLGFGDMDMDFGDFDF